MNIIPTLEGGLRVDLEEATDWLLLRHLIDDACHRDMSLAEELGSEIAERQLKEDWLDYVVPDLKEEFADDAELVTRCDRVERYASDDERADRAQTADVR